MVAGQNILVISRYLCSSTGIFTSTNGFPDQLGSMALPLLNLREMTEPVLLSPLRRQQYRFFHHKIAYCDTSTFPRFHNQRRTVLR